MSPEPSQVGEGFGIVFQPLLELRRMDAVDQENIETIRWVGVRIENLPQYPSVLSRQQHVGSHAPLAGGAPAGIGTVDQGKAQGRQAGRCDVHSPCGELMAAGANARAREPERTTRLAHLETAVGSRLHPPAPVSR